MVGLRTWGWELYTPVLELPVVSPTHFSWMTSSLSNHKIWFFCLYSFRNRGSQKGAKDEDDGQERPACSDGGGGEADAQVLGRELRDPVFDGVPWEDRQVPRLLFRQLQKEAHPRAGRGRSGIPRRQAPLSERK